MSIKALEARSLVDLVRESEQKNHSDVRRAHDYNLDDKSAKAKMLKGAKRIPIELVENKGSSNINFSVGAWNHVVLPSVRYWDSIKGEKTCKVDTTEIRIASVELGKDAGGLHIDTKVVFYANRNKIVCHLYNTTQRVLINGHGYDKFIKAFLIPYFETKINLNNQEIANFNKLVLESHGSRQVKRSSVKYKQGSNHICRVCDFSAKSLTSLRKHKESHNSVSFEGYQALMSSSTRNNSISEAILQENLTITNTSTESTKVLNLEETSVKEPINLKQIMCDWHPCDYKSSDKTELRKHIGKHLGQTQAKEVFECESCDYNSTIKEHVETHKRNEYEIEKVFCDASRDEVRENEDGEEVEVVEGHMEHINVFDNLEGEKCEICGEAYTNSLELEWHMETEHEDNKSLSSYCDFKSKNENEFQSHILSHKQEIVTPEGATIGDIEVPQHLNSRHNQDENNLGKHNENIHNTNAPQEENPIRIENIETCCKCEECGFVGDQRELEVHAVNHRKATNTAEPFPCEICGLVFGVFAHLQHHMISQHSKHRISCQYCTFTGEHEEALETHMIGQHAEIVILHTMAKQVDEMTDKYAQLERSLATILENQNSIKQELFILRNDQVNQEHNTNKETSRKETHTNTSNTNQKRKPKMLLIGDSITNHANIDVIENATGSVITKAKAYSAIHDDGSNVAKSAAKFPRKNFLQVVPAEAMKDNFDHLIVQTGSIDITNLKTEVSPEQNLEYFRQETVMSAKNMFDSCLLALDKQPSLKSVILMKQTPRYDPVSTDPLSLKPALSQLFNNTLTELWVSCPLKDKIRIGSHNIDCSGAIQSARYRHTKTGKFDGVHLYGTTGSKAYTNSVLNILRGAALTTPDYEYHFTCPQYKYQNKKYQGN